MVTELRVSVHVIHNANYCNGNYNNTHTALRLWPIEL